MCLVRDAWRLSEGWGGAFPTLTLSLCGVYKRVIVSPHSVVVCSRTSESMAPVTMRESSDSGRKLTPKMFLECPVLKEYLSWFGVAADGA